MKKALIILLLTSLFLTSCGTPQQGSAQPPDPAQTSEAAPTPEQTPEPTPEPTAEPYNQVGDTVMLGDWEITLSGCEITEKVSVNQYLSFKADDGNKYVIVTLTVKNTATTADSFLPSFSMGNDVSAKLLYQGEYEFSASNLLGHSDELHDKTLNPLSTAEGLIAFEVADEAAVLEELELELSLGKESVIYRLDGEAVSDTAMNSVEPQSLPAQDTDLPQSTEPTPASDQSAEPTLASNQGSELPQDVEPMLSTSKEPESSEPAVLPAPEPVVQPEAQTAQTGENLPANFTEWVPYSTSDLQLLLDNIAKGNVIMYNGIYWASPTYANSLANEVIVYQNDIAGDVGTSNRFNFADIDISGLDDESEKSEDLDGFN